MPKFFPPNFDKSEEVRMREKQQIDEEAEVKKYSDACKWYEKHLLDVIYRESPVENHSPENWLDEFEDNKKEWVDAWQFNFDKMLKQGRQAEFYRDLKKNLEGHPATNLLVDAFKKLEVVWNLKSILSNEKTDNHNKIETFQEKLKQDKSILVARRREGGVLDTFARMLGVVCAAILGLPVFGIGAYFTAKAAHARLFGKVGTTGSVFVEKVSSKKIKHVKGSKKTPSIKHHR